MENFTSTSSASPVTRTSENAEPLPNMDIFYFCLPANDNLLKYWDTIQDRLFKIRHCMNIEGVVRQLPLFEPPIDPALLVKAAAAGVDLSSVLSNAAAPMGQYRFRILSQKAAEFCNDVRALGDKLLSVLEKKDAEGLALLRSVNEIKLLEAAIEVKKQQINEAKELGAGLEKGIDALDKRIEYYGSIPRMNDWEKWGAGVHGLGITFEIVATVLNTVAGGTHLIPQIKGGATGMGGSPTLTVEMGGKQVSDSSAKFAALFSGLASIAHQGAQMLETQGSYTRRDEENRFQKELAEKEKPPLEKQIEAAKIRISIAEKELENHELQIEQAKTMDEYMRNKYTNKELYDWMLKQLSTVYFQSYQLAYDMAKRAEKCFQFELGKPNASFIEFGYWDSLKKGLLAGERLVNDIHRMETAYFDEDKRELEITKNVSLAQFTPLDLLKLKENGECTITLPEWLYDMDYLGHYRRRIKSVSITIPCVVGPYTSINCTLSLTGNGIRVSDDVTGGYGDPLSTNSTQFMRNPVPIASIATSHGQNDAGMFDLNFNDDHYLPFEGAGAVSQWQIQMPKESNQFDFATISDVILHIKYTAVKGSTSLYDEAKRNLETVLPSSGLMLLILNNEFGTEWHRFLHPDNENNDQELSITLKPEHLPFYAYTKSVNKHIYLTRTDIILESPFNGDFDATLQLPGANTSSDESIPRDSIFGGMPHLAKTTVPPQTNALGNWKIKLKKNVDSTYKSLKREDIMNAYLIVGFKIQ